MYSFTSPTPPPHSPTRHSSPLVFTLPGPSLSLSFLSFHLTLFSLHPLSSPHLCFSSSPNPPPIFPHPLTLLLLPFLLLPFLLLPFLLLPFLLLTSSVSPSLYHPFPFRLVLCFLSHPPFPYPFLAFSLFTSPQLKAAEAALAAKAASGDGASSQVDTGAIDELKRAFELVEVSSPGISDQLLSRIFIHLQHR